MTNSTKINVTAKPLITAQKRAIKKEQLNKEAKIKMKVCLFSCVVLVGGMLYAAIQNGTADNEVLCFKPLKLTK